MSTICPHCEADITEWAEDITSISAQETPKFWSCPQCDRVLGVSDWAE